MSDFAKRQMLLPGSAAPAQDTEKMLLERLQNSATEDDHFRWLLFVVGYYRGVQRVDAAKALLQKFLRESEKSEYKVHCHLALGQIATDEQELETALNHFCAALALKPTTKKVEYVLLNNAGYCLNVLGRHGEGEQYCRKALAIDWVRPSAYRNLGVSLHGQGDLMGCAWALVEAAKADSSDNRASALLEKLLSSNPALVISNPWIMEGLSPSSSKVMETPCV
jgi:tetratricopeptide (TPR) repeat protein